MRPSVDDFMAEWASSQQQQQPPSSSSSSSSPSMQQPQPQPQPQPHIQLQHQPIALGNAEIWNPHVILDPSMVPTTTNNNTNNSNSNSNIYTLPTNPQVELIRRRAHEGFLQACFQILQTSQSQWKVKLPIPSLIEKWHMDAKLHETLALQQNNSNNKNNNNNSNKNPSGSRNLPLIASTTEIYALYCQQQQQQQQYMDPVLLQSPSAVSLFQPLLQAELDSARATSPPPLPKFQRQVQGIRKALQRAMVHAQETFHKQLQQAHQQELRIQSSNHHNNNSNNNNNHKHRLPKLELSSDMCRVTYAGVTLQLHAAYYQKLHHLFQRQQQQQQLEWKQVLFCILCRYDMIQGAGLQAGVPGKVMDVLMETLDCRMECFASPFNCRYGQYASAFGLDRCLGSLGSFFALELEEGCFQANPPFCEAFIKRFNLRMLHLLQVAQDNHKSLMFVVIVPTWKKSAAYQSLLDNTFLIHHLQLPQGKHWYTEGTQHRRKASFRVASFDTSLLFYQTTNAQTKWDIVSSTAETLSLLQEAFCQDPGQMIKQASSVVVGRDSSSNTTLEPNPKKRQRLAKDSASSPPPPPPKVQDVVPEPTTPSTTPQQGKRKRKQPKKKKSSKRTSILASNNPKEESQAQLNLLASLGLSSDKKNDSSQTIR